MNLISSNNKIEDFIPIKESQKIINHVPSDLISYHKPGGDLLNTKKKEDYDPFSDIQII